MYSSRCLFFIPLNAGIVLHGSIKYAAFLGDISTFVYCVHPMFVETVGKEINNSFGLYVAIALVSTIVGCVWHRQNKNIKKKYN